jgi:hypothetical protein
MSTFTIPQGVSSSSVTVLLCFTSNVTSLPATRLLVNGSEVPIGQWEEWTSSDGKQKIRHQRVFLSGLSAATDYDLTFQAGNQTASAVMATLPASLPPFGSRGFNVFLGSCFYGSNDPNGDVGRRFSAIPQQDRPDLKLLCGDQVYLDAPWSTFLWPRSLSWLEQEFVKRYEGTWGQESAGGGGFKKLLSSGANYFCADDHEFWNNAPYPGAYIANSWASGSREKWRRTAEQLFRVFQSNNYPQILSVGSLSFFVAEMRVERDDKRNKLMQDDQIAKLKTWIGGLSGPGVLITGQPMFATKAGIKGHLTDWNLPDFKQYEEIVQAVRRSRHDLLFLTGDVHFGRISSCRLHTGVTIFEVISSPMSLVDKAVGGAWNAAPDRFPAIDIPGVPASTIETERGYTMSDNHFLTLTFNSVGARVRFGVKVWPVSRQLHNTAREIFNASLD